MRDKQQKYFKWLLGGLTCFYFLVKFVAPQLVIALARAEAVGVIRVMAPLDQTVGRSRAQPGGEELTIEFELRSENSLAYRFAQRLEEAEPFAGTEQVHAVVLAEHRGVAPQVKGVSSGECHAAPLTQLEIRVADDDRLHAGALELNAELLVEPAA